MKCPRWFGGALIACLGSLSGCAAHFSPDAKVSFASSDPRWFDELGHAPALDVPGYLEWPVRSGNRVPAAVVIPSSQGVTALERQTADKLLAEGFAVLVVDNYEPRGLSRIKKDQSAVSEVAIMADAFAALRYLQEQPKVDRTRIVIVGSSKGGIAALYSAFDEVADAMDRSPDQVGFAAHVAFHPWCGWTPQDLRTTGAPILIHSGAEDRITPAGLCQTLVDEMRAESSNVEFRVYPGAKHAFEHPILARLPDLPIGYEVPTNCRIVGRDDQYVETSTEQAVFGSSYQAVLSECSNEGALGEYQVGGHRQHAERAWVDTIEFLRTKLAGTLDH